MNTRTYRDFTASTSIWPIVDEWAAGSSFRLKQQQTGQATRLYQRGYGLLTAPMMLQISQTGDKAHLEAWISVGTLSRLMALFLVPAEMGIESGGFKLVVPRNVARGAINKLLVALSQPPIP